LAKQQQTVPANSPSLVSLAEAYLAQEWVLEHMNEGGLGGNPTPPDQRERARRMLASGELTPQMLAANMEGGRVNPDGSLTYTSDDTPDTSGNLMLGAAMLGAGSAGWWAPGMMGEMSTLAAGPSGGGSASFEAGGGLSGPSAGMEDYAARVAAEDAAGGARFLSDTGQTYNGFLQNLGTAGGAALGASGGAAASTALGKVLNGTANAADYASVLGGGLGIASSLYGMSLAGDMKAPSLPGLDSFGGAGNLPALSTLSTGGGVPGAGNVSIGGYGGGSTAADFKGVDPWGEIGGRILAGDQLKSLLTDPSSITSMPDYEAGMQAVERSMAAQGYQGSGNMMAAMQKYGGQFYNQALTRLSQLAGTNQDPATAAKLAQQQNQLGVTARGQDMSYLLGQGQITNAQRGLY